MKRGILAAALAAVLACGVAAGGTCAFASEGVGGAVLVVTGTASVSAAADGCTFSGVIETVGDDLEAASVRSGEVFAAVRSAFEQYGRVEEEHFSVYAMCGQGYTATRCLRFYSEQAEKAEEMRAALSAAGMTSLDGAVPFCKDDAAHRTEALRLAVEDAKSKATQLGAEGQLVRAEEMFCCMSRSVSPSGEVTYDATVRAVFARVPQGEGRRPDTQENRNAA